MYSDAFETEIQYRLFTFMSGLYEAGMPRKRLLELAFDFALLLLEVEEEKGLKSGQNISPSVKAELMEKTQKMLAKIRWGDE